MNDLAAPRIAPASGAGRGDPVGQGGQGGQGGRGDRAGSAGRAGSGRPAIPAAAPLRAALSGMAERTRAQLAWHFEHARPAPFVEADPDARPDALILDADHPEAFAALDAFAARTGAGARTPVVLLAFDRPPEALTRRATHVVPKPVTPEALGHAARVLRGEAQASLGPPDTPPGPFAPPGPTGVPAVAARLVAPAVAPPVPAPRPIDPAEAERARLREAALCGERGAIDAALAARRERGPDDPGAAGLFFDPDRHVGALLEAELGAARARPGPRGLSVAMPHIELFVLPDVGRVYASATLRSVATARATFAPLGPDGATVTHHAGPGMAALLRRVRTLARGGYTLDAFIWLAALMSSRGRLPVGTDPERRARLRRWPNLTRLEPVPHAVELARRWVDAPRSIEALGRETGIEPRFVHAFHNAARALGLFEEDAPRG